MTNKSTRSIQYPLSRRAALGFLLGATAWVAVACGRNRNEPSIDASPDTGITPHDATAQNVQEGRTPANLGGSSRAVQAQEISPTTDRARLPEPTPTPSGPVLPDRLVIPRIELDIPVVELGWSANRNNSGAIFSEWDVAAHAAGWHKNSALPGQSGNIVMSGHNNILGAVFRQLDQLRRDDEITVYSAANPRIYRVERVLIVPEKHATDAQRAENAEWIAPTTDERLTLVSCWPRNDNTHRIIVVAKPA